MASTPDLLWIESVTERLLGSANRFTRWESASNGPSDDLPSVPAQRGTPRSAGRTASGLPHLTTAPRVGSWRPIPPSPLPRRAARAWSAPVGYGPLAPPVDRELRPQTRGAISARDLLADPQRLAGLLAESDRMPDRPTVTLDPSPRPVTAPTAGAPTAAASAVAVAEPLPVQPAYEGEPEPPIYLPVDPALRGLAPDELLRLDRGAPGAPPPDAPTPLFPSPPPEDGEQDAVSGGRADHRGRCAGHGHRCAGGAHRTARRADADAPAPDAPAPDAPVADTTAVDEPAAAARRGRHRFPRSADQLSAADIALRLAFRTGDDELAAAAVSLVASQEQDRQRLRTLQAYLDALLDEGGDALPGARRLRRLLGD